MMEGGENVRGGVSIEKRRDSKLVVVKAVAAPLRTSHWGGNITPLMQPAWPSRLPQTERSPSTAKWYHD